MNVWLKKLKIYPEIYVVENELLIENILRNFVILFSRYLDDSYPRNLTLPRTRSGRFQRSQDAQRKISRISSASSPPVQQNHAPPPRGYSLDRKKSTTKDYGMELDPISIDNTPILFNKYIVGKDGGFDRMIPGKGKISSFLFWTNILVLDATRYKVK